MNTWEFFLYFCSSNIPAHSCEMPLSHLRFVCVRLDFNVCDDSGDYDVSNNFCSIGFTACTPQRKLNTYADEDIIKNINDCTFSIVDFGKYQLAGKTKSERWIGI